MAFFPYIMIGTTVDIKADQLMDLGKCRNNHNGRADAKG